MPINNSPFYYPNDPFRIRDPYNPSNINWDLANNQSPEGSWLQWLNRYQLGGLNTQSSAANALYSRARQGYAASQIDRPDLSWTRYLANLPDARHLMNTLSPDERGENAKRYVGPLRWEYRQQ